MDMIYKLTGANVNFQTKMQFLSYQNVLTSIVVPSQHVF